MISSIIEFRCSLSPPLRTGRCQSFKSVMTTFRQLVRQEVYRLRDKVARASRKRKRTIDLEDGPDRRVKGRAQHDALSLAVPVPASTSSASRPLAEAAPSLIALNEPELFNDMPPLESGDTRCLPSWSSGGTVSSSLYCLQTPPLRDAERSSGEVSEEPSSSSSSDSEAHCDSRGSSTCSGSDGK